MVFPVSGPARYKAWISIALLSRSIFAPETDSSLMNSPPLHIPVFPGQGTPALFSPQTRTQALLDASSPAASTLLSAYHQTFLAELSAVSASDLQNIDVDTTDFIQKESLLELPRERYANNPIISGTSLFIIQTLRYLAFIEATASSTNSLTPFSDLLKPNLEHGLGILGFSSGILPACVVASSFSTISYISRAVEAYRLAIWIGVRTQLYRRATLDAAFIDRHTALPWSLVFLGMSKTKAEESIANFNKVSSRGPSFLFLSLTNSVLETRPLKQLPFT